QSWPVLAGVVISAAPAASRKHHSHALVLIVNGSRQIWRHAALIIRVRDHYQNVHFEPLVGTFHGLNRSNRLRFHRSRDEPPQRHHKKQKRAFHSHTFRKPFGPSSKARIVPAPSRESLNAPQRLTTKQQLYSEHVSQVLHDDNSHVRESRRGVTDARRSRRSSTSLRVR